MAKIRMNKFKKLGASSETKKVVVLKKNLKVSYATVDRKKHTTVEFRADQRQKSTYTFSSIFPNADIMNRAHKIIRQVEYVK